MQSDSKILSFFRYFVANSIMASILLAISFYVGWITKENSISMLGICAFTSLLFSLGMTFSG